MPRSEISYKEYSLEIILGIIEVGTKPFILMMTFLYGKGKINFTTFLTFICALQFIGSILLIKNSIYDQSKISDKINRITHKVQNNNDIHDQKNFLAFSIAMYILNLSSMMVSNIVVILYKKDKITSPVYVTFFIFSFIIASIPIILFRRKEYSTRKKACNFILETLDNSIDVQNKNTKRQSHVETLFACIEIISKSLIVMLHFLYGRGRVNYRSFLITVSLVQLIGSTFFIKNVIYDTKTIHNQLNRINEIITVKASDQTIVEESKTDNRAIITMIMLVTQMFTIANIPITVYYKENQISFISYILSSSLLFIISIVPTVVYRRIQKVEDDFICNEIIENMKNINLDQLKRTGNQKI